MKTSRHFDEGFECFDCFAVKTRSAKNPVLLCSSVHNATSRGHKTQVYII